MDMEALTPTTAREVPEDEQAEWDVLFLELQSYLADAAADAPDSATLASGISAFAKSKGLGARQLAGLSFRVDSAWTQDYGADPSQMSLKHFNDDAELGGGDSIIAKGFTASVLDMLASALKAKGGRVLLCHAVTAVAHGPQGVKVTANGKDFAGAFAIVTVPAGVLSAKAVKFTPPLPAEKAAALENIGMGTLNKVLLSFPVSAKLPAANWVHRLPLASDKGRFREFFSLKKITGRPVVVGFNAGSAAEYPAAVTDKALVDEAVAALRAMFGGAAKVPAPEQSFVTRWHADPFSRGAYSYLKAGATGDEREALAAPVGRRLYFAGEAARARG